MTQGFTANIDSAGFYGLTPLGPTLPNVLIANGFVGNAGAGDIDLYTVPTGRRALILQLSAFSGGGNTVAFFPQVKISGTYYRLATGSSVASNAFSSVTVNGYVAEAGEILSVNTAATGANLWFRILEFDDSSNLFSAKLTSLALGDNTLYTVSSGKSAYVLSTGFATTTSIIALWNNSGSSRTYSLFVVPNGGSSATSNKTANAISVTNGTVSGSGNTSPVLNSNDFIVINTDANTATQFCFVTVCEVP